MCIEVLNAVLKLSLHRTLPLSIFFYARRGGEVAGGGYASPSLRLQQYSIYGKC